MTDRAQCVAWWRRPVAVAGIALVLLGNYAVAQNLGDAPQTNVAVQGETGAQPEGAFLNFINWVGNVIAPVGAGGAVVGAIVSWLTGRGFGRWLHAAAAHRGFHDLLDESCGDWDSGLDGRVERRTQGGAISHFDGEDNDLLRDGLQQLPGQAEGFEEPDVVRRSARDRNYIGLTENVDSPGS